MAQRLGKEKILSQRRLEAFHCLYYARLETVGTDSQLTADDVVAIRLEVWLVLKLLTVAAATLGAGVPLGG